MMSNIAVSTPTDPRPAPEGSKDHHPKKGSKIFTNPWPSFVQLAGMWTFLKAGIKGEINPKESLPKNISELVGLDTPKFQTGDKSKIKTLWLGHACFYVELPCREDQERGLRLLVDPVFSDRCSPVSCAGPKRFVAPPTPIDLLPEIDFVCISHNHYDHLDEPTIKRLYKRFGESIHFFIPLGVAKFFKSWKVLNFTELDWWEEKILKKGNLEARIGYLPAQHFSGRGLFDQSESLWGSYSIESTSHPDKKLWFGGDTGRRSIPREIEMGLPKTQEELDNLPVCPAHKQIGDLRGPFTLALIPIGAYKPRYLMSPVHIDPIEAIEIFKEVRAEKAVGMHWGTWTLSAEGYTEPRDELIRLCKAKGIDGFETWKIGERKEV